MGHVACTNTVETKASSDGEQNQKGEQRNLIGFSRIRDCILCVGVSCKVFNVALFFCCLGEGAGG